MMDYSTPRTIRRFPITKLILEPHDTTPALEYIEIGWLSSESTLSITAVQRPNSRGGMTIIGVDVVATIVIGNNTNLRALLSALELYAAAPRVGSGADQLHFHANLYLGGTRSSDKLTTVINSDGEQIVQMCNLNAPVAVEISAESANLIPLTTIKFSTRVKKFSDILWG